MDEAAAPDDAGGFQQDGLPFSSFSPPQRTVPLYSGLADAVTEQEEHAAFLERDLRFFQHF